MKQSRFERLEAVPKAMGDRLKENPAAGLAVVGVASFLLGGLVGSKLGRVAVAAAIPVLMARILEGKVGNEIVRYVEGLIVSHDSPRRANT